MTLKFITDENVPSLAVEALREAGYDVATVSEVSRPGMKNEELAKLSIQLGMIIVTRDADFTRLSRSLTEKIKVVYVKLSGDPSTIAKHLLKNIGR